MKITVLMRMLQRVLDAHGDIEVFCLSPGQTLMFEPNLDVRKTPHHVEYLILNV